MVLDKLQVKTEVYRALRVVATVAAIVAAAKTLIWPWVQQQYFAGPAVVMKKFSLQDTPAGSWGQLTINVDKIRPCKIQSAGIDVKDSAGVVWNIENTLLTVSLQVNRNQAPRFTWKAPANAALGKAQSASIEIWHGECRDGPDPRSSVRIVFDPPTILAREVDVSSAPHVEKPTGNEDPVVKYTAAVIKGAAPGQFGTIALTLDKFRSCKVLSSTVYATDASGFTLAMSLKLDGPLPVGKGVKGSFKFQIADTANTGPVVYPYLETYFKECADGNPAPATPARFDLPVFEVYKPK